MADARYINLDLWPAPFAGASGFANFTLNQNTDAVEFIFQAAEAATITKLGVRLGTITGTTPTYRVSLQGVDASGHPDGTIKGGGSPASKTFSPSGLGWAAGSWNWLTLDNSYACTRGESLAIVIDYSSGTVDGSNNASFSYYTDAAAGALGVQTQYGITNDNGSRSKQLNWSVFGYASNTKAYGHPIESASQISFNSGSAADEYAIKFTVPADWCDTYKVRGIRVLSLLIAAGTTKLILYSGTDTTAVNSTGAVTETTVAQDVTYDNDHRVTTGGFGVYDILFDEATLSTLYAGATYRLALQPQGAQDTYIIVADVDAAADFDAWPLGQDAHTSTRVNAGNWTDVTTRRLQSQILLSDITEPAGGGGGGMILPRSLNGGLV
jgi:hypothetical protein